MAFSFRRGGPQVGAVGALALVAGMMALGKPATAPAAGVAALPDHPRPLRLPETIATSASGSPRIPNLMMGAGGLAGATVLGRGQLDRGRFTI